MCAASSLRLSLDCPVNTPILTSTLLLTGLMMIGLFFFIRAATKDRTEVAQLVTEQPETALLEQIQQYFTDRAYRIAAVDAAENQVTYTGVVRPSAFLAVFLTLLAGVGLLCLALVLSILLPRWSDLLPGLAVLAPLAGLFYWRKAGRPEQVKLQIAATADARSLITVTAHRDELAELQRSLPLQPFEG